MAVLGSALPAQARQDDPSLFNRQAVANSANTAAHGASSRT